MSRNEPPEGTHVGGIFRDVAYGLGSIAPARPLDGHVPCLEDHRRRSTTCLGSWSLNSMRDGPALPQRSIRERPFLFTTPLQLRGRCMGPGKC